jgi:hypothetical protein
MARLWPQAISDDEDIDIIWLVSIHERIHVRFSRTTKLSRFFPMQRHTLNIEMLYLEYFVKSSFHSKIWSDENGKDSP